MDAGIEAARKTQIKNFLLTLLISRGVPMLLGGDEFRRSQGGNNNAYCQDNETSWYDWSHLKQHSEIFRFTHGMIAFRRAHPVLSAEHFYTDAEIHWFGPQGGLPDWTDPKGKQLACLIHEDGQRALYLMFNAGAEAVDVGLPPVAPGGQWHLAVDTAREAPMDLFAAGEELIWEHPRMYRLDPRSSAILLAR
jgi:glycogen operon protein